jgi:hypothetical protein
VDEEEVNSSEESDVPSVRFKVDDNSLNVSKRGERKNSEWRRHIRLKDDVICEYESFGSFVRSEMSRGRLGFRTRPGIDKYRFKSRQRWFPRSRLEQISCGQYIAHEMMSIPAIKDRFYVKGYLNPGGSAQNSSEYDIFELHIMDLIPSKA